MSRGCEDVLHQGIVPVSRVALKEVCAVCIDRNGAYRSVLRGKLPGAEVVHDRFHIIAFFKHRITSGKIASFNNQIARLIHRACGMANLRHLFFKMRAQSIKQT